MRVYITKDYDELSKRAAAIVAQQIRQKPNSVLGLPTGSTPIGPYKELIRMHREEGLDFSKVTTFNMDEYYGLSPDHEQSYHYFMRQNLFNHINIDPRNVHIPNGRAEDVNAFCQWYEDEIRRRGGIDLQLAGIGSDGHIAFNEPGSSLGSRTRIKTLTQQTIEDNARFFEKPEDVPQYALTVGVGTVMEARKILFMANGEKKADIIAKFIEGPVTAEVTASVLQMHPWVTVILDKAAGSRLKRKDYYAYVAKKEQEFGAFRFYTGF